MIDTSFIIDAKQKLIDSHSRSIFVNALPSRRLRSRIDLLSFQELSFYFSGVKLATELFKKNNFEVHYENVNQVLLDPTFADYLFHFYKKNEEINEDYNISPFGIGYPLLKWFDSKKSKFNYTPVFIFKLSLGASSKFGSSFVLKRDSDSLIYVNPSLLYSLGENNLDSEILQNLNSDLNENDDNLHDTLEIICKLLNISFSEIPLSQKILTPLKIESVSKNEKNSSEIVNNGVFGLYLNSKESLLMDYNHLDNHSSVIHFKNFEKPKFDNFFTGLRLDHSQQNAVNKVINGKDLVIHGPPGTGKSKTITAIILHAFRNKRRCLMICQKRTAMDVIFNNLTELGLSEYAMVITDVKNDRKQVVDKVRSKIHEFKNGYNSLFSDSNTLTNYKSKAPLITKKIEHIAKVINHVFDTKNRLNEKPLTSYESFTESVLNAGAFWLNENPSAINVKNFKFDKEEYKALKQKINAYRDKYKEIFNYSTSYVEIINKELLNKSQIQELERIKFGLEEIIHDCQILKSQLNTFQARNNFTPLKYFDRSVSTNSSLNEIFDKAQYLLERVMNLNVLDAKLRGYLRGCSLSKRIDHLIDFIQCFLSDADKHDLFSDFFLSIERENYRDRELIMNCLKDDLFEDTFFSWYTLKVLKNVPLDYMDFNGSSRGAYDLGKEIDYVNDFILEQIIVQLDEKRLSAFMNFEKHDKTLTIEQFFSKRSVKGRKKKSLTQIIQHPSGVFQSFFPLVITNPSSCASLFPMEVGYFDYVIFDESSQLRVEETFTALLRGKQKVVAGDLQQLPPMNYFSSVNEFRDESRYSSVDSLLSFCLEMNFDESDLNIHYRSKHPSLINFSNHAFYKASLIPMPQKQEYTPIEFYQVGGVFIKRTNKIEANKVVDYLENNVDPSISVGIATFNLLQADLILNEVQKRANHDPKFQAKLSRLKQRGLFVKNIENIQGEERDLMIIATTFGVDEKGRFFEYFGPLNTRNRGDKLLNVLITRSLNKMVIITSIPEDKIDSVKIGPDSTRTAKHIFYAFLKYSKAVYNNEHEEASKVLSNFKNDENNIDSSYFLDTRKLDAFTSAFVERLNSVLSFEITYLLNFRLGGFTFEIALLKNNLVFAIIDINGKLNTGNFESYLFDLQRNKICNDVGLLYYRLWISNLIANPEQEFSRIVRLLISDQLV